MLTTTQQAASTTAAPTLSPDLDQQDCGCGCGFPLAPGMYVHLINNIAYTQGCVSALIAWEPPPHQPVDHGTQPAPADLVPDRPINTPTPPLVA